MIRNVEKDIVNDINNYTNYHNNDRSRHQCSFE
jgi:hypothetical protein